MTSSPVLGSIIVPAHNEVAGIEACLHALLDGFSSPPFEVVVVCNGCTDQTASVAQSVHSAVRVVEIAEASKTAALQAGDEHAVAFPRLYLDADVVLPATSAVAVLQCLSTSGGPLAARPPLRYDLDGAEPLVRSYYRARLLVPALFDRLWGAGIYGLSRVGRERFADWPEVVGDDLFIDSLFAADEKRIVHAAPVVVRVPRTTRSLIAVLRRGAAAKSPAANALNAGGRPLPADQSIRTTVSGLVAAVRKQPAVFLDVMVYSSFAVLGRLDRIRSRRVGWERDDSTRPPT